MTDFATKYCATSFDPDDPNEALAERARQALITAYRETLDEVGEQVATRPAEYCLGGLLVGVVQIMQSSLESGNATDASIRASIQQVAPWAVDMARAMQGLEPLSDGN